MGPLKEHEDANSELHDDSSDEEGLGDDSGLSELGTSCTSTTAPSWFSYISRSDSTVSRLAAQLEDTRFFAKSIKPSCGSKSGRSSDTGSTVSFRSFMKPAKLEDSGLGSETSGSDIHPDFVGNGKNSRRVVDLPDFVPQS